MKPIEFPEMNTVIAKDQGEYLPLPAYVERSQLSNGEVVTCWKLTFLERLKVLFTGKFWFTVYAFGHPLQPQRPSVNKWDTLDKNHFESIKGQPHNIKKESQLHENYHQLHEN